MFSPSPQAADLILSALAGDDLTLKDIAEEHNTSLEALTLWMAQPDIAQRLANLESAIAHRTRLSASNALPRVVQTLTRIIDEYNDEETQLPLPERGGEAGRGRGYVQARGPGGSIAPNSPPLYSGSNLPEHRESPLRSYTYLLTALENRRRSRETARRAASLLLRLARFRSSPSGGDAERSEAEGDFRKPCPPRAPNPISQRAPRAVARSESADDLIARAATLAPRLSALAGAAGGSQPPASSSTDGDRASDPRAESDAAPPHHHAVVELPLPSRAFHHSATPFPIAPTTNSNGHPLPAANEHWP